MLNKKYKHIKLFDGRLQEKKEKVLTNKKGKKQRNIIWYFWFF